MPITRALDMYALLYSLTVFAHCTAFYTIASRRTDLFHYQVCGKDALPIGFGSDSRVALFAGFTSIPSAILRQAQDRDGQALTFLPSRADRGRYLDISGMIPF